MDPGYFSAFAALAGSAIGGLTSLGTSWLTQHVQFRAQQLAHDIGRREELYKDFIEEASKLNADACEHSEADLAKLVRLYAIGRDKLTVARSTGTRFPKTSPLLGLGRRGVERWVHVPRCARADVPGRRPPLPIRFPVAVVLCEGLATVAIAAAAADRRRRGGSAVHGRACRTQDQEEHGDDGRLPRTQHQPPDPFDPCSPHLQIATRSHPAPQYPRVIGGMRGTSGRTQRAAYQSPPSRSVTDGSQDSEP